MPTAAARQVALEVVDSSSQLSAAAVDALSALAAFEHPVDLELAIDLVGVARSELLVVLDEAERAGLAGVETGQVRFAPSARDLLYQRLGPGGQARAHAHAAAVLEKHRPGDIRGRALQLAGAVSLVGQDAVLSALDQAAAACERICDWQEAVEMLGRAAYIARARHDARADDFDLRRAAALYRAGLYRESMSVCRTVATSARASSNAALLAAAALVVRGIDDREICAELLHNLDEAEAGLAHDSALFARVTANKVLLEAQRNRRPADAGRAAEALAQAERTGDDRAIIEALHCTELSLQGPRHVHERLRIAERMQQCADQAGLDEYLRWPLSWRVDGLWLLGERPALDDAVDLLAEHGNAHNDGLTTWKACIARAALAAVEGRFADAHTLADTALEAARAGGHDSAVFMDKILRSHLASLTAVDPAGLVQIEDFPRGGEVFAIYPAMEAAARGDVEHARILFDKSWPFIDRVVDHELELSFYWAFATTITSLDLSGPAAELYRRMVPFAEMMAVGASGTVISAGCISACMGEMAALAGDWTAMDRDFARALRRNIEFGDRPSAAATRYSWARGLLRHGLARDFERASALMAAALRGAQLLGMAALIRAIGELQRNLDRRPVHPLSSRELEVAQLVAQGLSNKDVASSLRLSARTVESHLLSIMSKLGMENRAQVAAWITRTQAATRDR